MAQRPIWRGHLRLALVSYPVALFSARHERDAIRFNMINPITGNRIKMVSQDAQTGDEVARRARSKATNSPRASMSLSPKRTWKACASRAPA